LPEPRAVYDFDLTILDLDEALGAKTSEIPGNYFTNRAQARGQFLVGGRQVENLGASSASRVQQHFGQSLGDASKGHSFHQAHQIPESPSYDGQDFERNIRVLTAELLKIRFVDEQGDHGVNHANGRRIRATVEQRQFGYGSRSGLDGEHHFTPARRGAKYLDASLNHQEYAGACLTFPEEHVAGRESLFYGSLGQALTFGLAQGRE